MVSGRLVSEPLALVNSTKYQSRKPFGACFCHNAGSCMSRRSIMQSIYYAVRIIALLWVLMVAFVAIFGLNQNLKADRASGVALAVTISSILPIIKQTIDSGVSASGAFSWGFPLVSYLGFLLFF